jgi:hypothetical protein
LLNLLKNYFFQNAKNINPTLIVQIFLKNVKTFLQVFSNYLIVIPSMLNC